MLVLDRAAGETIRIGSEIVVTIVRVSRGRRVRVGITAPGMSIHRQEIYDEIHAGPITPDPSQILPAVIESGVPHDRI